MRELARHNNGVIDDVKVKRDFIARQVERSDFRQGRVGL